MKHSKSNLIILGVLISILISGCTNAGTASSWPGLSLKNDVGYFSYGTQVFAMDAKNGDVIWRFPLEPDAKNQYFAAPAIGQSEIVVGSYSNSLVSLDINNGSQQWVFIQADDKYIGSSLVINNMVFAPNSDGYLYALDNKGILSWKFNTKGPNWTVPVTDGIYVYLASMDHFLYAFEQTYPIDSLQKEKDGDQKLLKEPLWFVDLNAAVVANPVLMDGIIYVGTIDGKLHAVSIEDRKISWTFTSGDDAGSIWGAPAITDGALYFGDEKGNLYAVSIKDGSALWSTPYNPGASLIAGGAVTDEGIVFISDDGKIFSINVDKQPTPLLTLNPTIFSSPVYSNGRIIIAPAVKDELFKAIDLNGKEIWTFSPAK